MLTSSNKHLLHLATLLSATLVMTGCAASIKPAPDYSKDLTELCAEARALASGTHSDVEVWAIQTAGDLAACRARHKALVEAIERRKSLYGR